jgi:Tfp pilus assembly protein PilN
MPATDAVTGVPQTTARPVTLPRVNLMPPEIAEAARFRRFQLAMGGAVAAAVVIVGALYVHQHSAVKNAQEDLTRAKAQETALQSKLASLAAVEDVYNQVAQKQAMLSQAMGAEIRWSYYLTDLSLKVPDNVWLTNIQAEETATGLTPTATAPTATSSALTTPGIGTISFDGTAFKHDDVATWLDVLARERGYANAYFTKSTEDKTEGKTLVDFSTSVVITDAAKSGRYAEPAGS